MREFPLLLLILDGWGLGREYRGNAIYRARTPNYDHLLSNYPSTSLVASGEAVGLPEGQMGNSEVGHLNLGAGRIVYQEYTRINKALDDGSFYQNEVLLELMKGVEERGTRLHLIGLLSDGGVHSHLRHLFGLLELASSLKLDQVFIHAIMDGRDTPPRSGERYLRALEDKLQQLGSGRVATVSGRFYSMDRDLRWQRTARAYRCHVLGEGETASSSLEALKASYRQDKGDEFVPPTLIGNTEGPLMQDGDGVLCFNFRADRARQLIRVLASEDFNPFPRPAPPQLEVVTMTSYDRDFELPVVFSPLELKNTLARVLAEGGLRQLHMAETEKYAHVTFFFNGGQEEPVPGEERKLIPSPGVETYDLQPEMSAGLLTDFLLESLQEGRHDFIVLNYANPDMVGHTGMLAPCMQAIEVLDKELGRVLRGLKSSGVEALITADHGNAEEMLDEDGGEHTAHTSNPVPLIYYGPRRINLASGSLQDIAPTILELMGINPPPEMTGNKLMGSEVK